MLSPEYLEHVADELEEYFASLENDIVKDIAKRLSLVDFTEITATSAYRIQKARELGITYDELIRKVKEHTKVSDQKVKELITESCYRSFYGMDNVSFNDGELADILKKGIKQTNGELHNFTKTMAKESAGMLERALDKAYLQVRSGAFDHKSAIRNAVEELGRNGIQCVNYRSGRRDHVDVAVRRAVRTGVNKTANEMQYQNAIKYKLNFAHVSQHLGARPEHEKWQGGIYWIYKEVKGYENFKEKTRFGFGDGLGGWNCRHSFSCLPFPDKSKIASIDSEENDRVYRLTQEQRYNERKIREWKRRKAAKEGAGFDTTKEDSKIKEWQKRNRELVKDNPELRRQLDREKVIPNSKAKAKGLSAGEKSYNLTQQAQVISRGRLTKTDTETKMKVLKAYEKRIVSYDHERAVVIAEDGTVYEVVGISGRVYPEQLGKKILENAFVTHNHPINETEFTFSEDDLEFFKNFKLGMLRGVDNHFVYQLVSDENITVRDEDYDDWFNDLNARHAVITDRCIEQNLYYWRNKNER